MSGKRRVLFLDRDGTLIEEPADEQVDRLDKVRLVAGVLPALLQLKAAGFEMVLVSNQDGLGTESFPQQDFDGPHQLMLQIFNSQGIEFSAEHIDPTLPEDMAATRKPNIGMLLDYLRRGDLDFERSYVIGDRQTDLELADNLGVKGLLLGPDGLNWDKICSAILDQPRAATVERATSETRIRASVNLDQSGEVAIDTGIGFFDHMLEQLALHGGFNLELKASGDLHIDEHHTVEDSALTLGQALNQALGDKHGIGRYGFVLPMDESRAAVTVDLSGRPAFVMDAALPMDRIGEMTTEMVKHFFQTLSQSLAAAIHINVTGENTHHMVEAMFKGLGRALRPALARTDQSLPSSKGSL